MDVIETFFFESKEILDRTVKGKQVRRRNLKKHSCGYAKVIDGCLKDSSGDTKKKHSYTLSNTENSAA